jgi:hypothetical protein
MCGEPLFVDLSPFVRIRVRLGKSAITFDFLTNCLALSFLGSPAIFNVPHVFLTGL